MSDNKQVITNHLDANHVDASNVNEDENSLHANTEDANTDTDEKGDYAARKHRPDIDGPQQDSQETDEVYDDTRDDTRLPPAGKNVGDLNAFDLGRHDK